MPDGSEERPPPTEKELIDMCGWPVFREARSIYQAEGVTEAAWEGHILRGVVRVGGKMQVAGLRFNSRTDVDNLCPCRDSRVRGILCAHSIAVGLEVLKPGRGRPKEGAATGFVPEGTRPTRSQVLPHPQQSGPKPAVQITLEGSLRHLEAEIVFEYAEGGGRNPVDEAAVLAVIARAGFEDFRGRPALRGEAAILRFVASELPRWKREWKVRLGERFAELSGDLVPMVPRFSLNRAGEGWLDFRVHFTAGREAVLSADDLRRLLAGGNPSIRLKDGRTAVPDANLLEDMEEVLRDCDPRQERGAYRVQQQHADYLAACMQDWSGEPAEDLSPDPGLLRSLRARLRAYQVEGAAWLAARAKKRSFGLLADEMGLGKTVQTLAMIEAFPGPHLVVCPSSLVWNWKQEAARFLPSLRVAAIDGPNREALIAQIGNVDLAITSYALLRRDIERYGHTEFTSVILDEAQHIKNPDSQNAKSASALQAKSRFILTGTPLENSVRDLWSLFGFLAPGMLGTRKDFQERYEKPILEGTRGAVWQRLVRRVRPHILRRRKAELLKELPQKIEQTLEVDLSPTQKAAYDQLQSAARERLDELDAGGGPAKMQVLAALLRLRQACCDVRLLGRETAEPSAKLEALREITAASIDSGGRLLVFSQFTSMLDLIEESMDEDGVSWVRLDGSTRDRAGVVERFQNDAGISVFLISLKAGGVGLNLTGADTVVHFDPWWNPAAEAQATDRAHRIGQTKVVTAIKIVARDTVEQRVLALQDSKRELLSGVLDEPESGGGVSNEDLRALLE